MEKQQQQSKPVANEELKSSDEIKTQPQQTLPAAAQVLTAIREGAAVNAIPGRRLEQLASALGNSALSGLLKSIGSQPETCSFDCPRSEAGSETANGIETSPPELFDAPEMSRYIDKPWRPFSPDNICDRAVPVANDAELNGMLLMTNDEIQH